MRQIEYLEILKAIRICVEKTRYKVGVFTSTMRYAKLTFDDFVKAIHGDEEESAMVERARDTMSDKHILFKNGSYIMVLPASENARGHKFNLVLHCDGIDREILDTVVRHTEFRYREENDSE